MNILILGGTLFVGRIISQKLVNSGHNVTLASRGNNPIPLNCRYVAIDREKPIIPETLLVKWDVIIDQSTYSLNHIKNTQQLFRFAHRYVFTSSQAVYPSGVNLRESDTNLVSNINEYGIAKLQSEQFVLANHQNAICPRFPVIVGQNDPHQRISKLIQQIDNGKVEVPDKQFLFNLISQEQAAKILCFLATESAYTGPLNIASPDIHTPSSLIKILKREITTKKTLQFTKMKTTSPFDIFKPYDKTLDCSLATREGITARFFQKNIVDELGST